MKRIYYWDSVREVFFDICQIRVIHIRNQVLNGSAFFGWDWSKVGFDNIRTAASKKIDGGTGIENLDNQTVLADEMEFLISLITAAGINISCGVALVEESVHNRPKGWDVSRCASWSRMNAFGNRFVGKSEWLEASLEWEFFGALELNIRYDNIRIF